MERPKGPCIEATAIPYPAFYSATFSVHEGARLVQRFLRETFDDLMVSDLRVHRTGATRPNRCLILALARPPGESRTPVLCLVPSFFRFSQIIYDEPAGQFASSLGQAKFASEWNVRLSYQHLEKRAGERSSAFTVPTNGGMPARSLLPWRASTGVPLKNTSFTSGFGAVAMHDHTARAIALHLPNEIVPFQLCWHRAEMLQLGEDACQAFRDANGALEALDPVKPLSTHSGRPRQRRANGKDTDKAAAAADPGNAAALNADAHGSPNTHAKKVGWGTWPLLPRRWVWERGPFITHSRPIDAAQAPPACATRTPGVLALVSVVFPSCTWQQGHRTHSANGFEDVLVSSAAQAGLHCCRRC
jgi:hypothetical protein